MECSCKDCVSACEECPGWMHPGQLEKIALHLNMPVEQMFKEYLSVDWWVIPTGNIYMLAPAIERYEGRSYPSYPHGRCIFLKDGLCMVHEVKPVECALAGCGDERTDEERYKFRESLALAWQEEKWQEMIKRLRRENGPTLDGKLHREYGPAVEDDKSCWLNGKLHREE